MGKVREPKTLLMDAQFHDTPEAKELEAQGHHVVYMDFAEYDMIISPIAQMTPMGRLGYVVKKLKEIMKEIKR